MPATINPKNLTQLLSLEVPLVVRLAERHMTISEVLSLAPGSIVELSKGAEAELDLLCNDKQIGCGSAVKVNENFGIRLTYLGDVRARTEAAGRESMAESTDDAAAALARQLLSGNL